MDRERLAENMLSFVPLMFKKLARGFASCGISRLQLELLFLIGKESEKPMRHYSDKMVISKPNLTVMADKMIQDGLIERTYDPNDRRIILLKITEEGKKVLKEHGRSVKLEVAKKLEAFEDGDVQRLNELIEEMKAILNKVDQ